MSKLCGVRLFQVGLPTLALAVLPSQAAVRQSSPDGMQIATAVEIARPPAEVYASLTDIQRWWGSGHTYSGDAKSLSLVPEAGGCWCERWPGGSVEHARVLFAMPGQALRLEGAFGPLQEMAVTGVLTFAIAPVGEGSRLDLTYRVSGTPAHGLDQLAAVVDAVFVEQIGRLKRLLETGSPDAAMSAAPAGSGSRP